MFHLPKIRQKAAAKIAAAYEKSLAAVSLLFQLEIHFLQMLGQRAVRTEGGEKVILGSGILVEIPDVVLDALVFHDDLVFLGELLQLDNDLAGMHHVDDEHAEEHTNEEGKRQIVGQPRQRIQDIGMHQK